MYRASTGQKYILNSRKMSQQMHKPFIYTVILHVNTKIVNFFSNYYRLIVIIVRNE